MAIIKIELATLVLSAILFAVNVLDKLAGLIIKETDKEILRIDYDRNGYLK